MHEHHDHGPGGNDGHCHTRHLPLRHAAFNKRGETLGILIGQHRCADGEQYRESNKAASEAGKKMGHFWIPVLWAAKVILSLNVTHGDRYAFKPIRNAETVTGRTAWPGQGTDGGPGTD